MHQPTAITAVAAGALLLALAATTATAHLTNANGSPTSAGFGGLANPDPCRWASRSSYPLPEWGPCATHDRVSGTYVSTATAFVSHEPIPLAGVAVCAAPDVGVGRSCQGNPVAATSGRTLFPNGYVAQGSMLCDAEWINDPDLGDPTTAGNEAVVDGQRDPEGLQPDGTWDDGGVGGACHHKMYPHPAGTPGCSGAAHAEDWTTAGHVWIGAACDWVTAPPSPAQTTVPCLVVAVAIGDPTTQAVVRCVESFLDGVDAPVLQCGSDGRAETTNFGVGGGRSGLGVPYPQQPACSGVGGNPAYAMVFAFDAVDAQTGAIVPATGGWIDST